MTTSKWVLIALACVCVWTRCCSGDESIDSILAAEHSKHSLSLAPQCDDYQFLRRVTLDLAGRIPTLDEIKTFKNAPDRPAKIEQLLASDEFSSSWAETWTSMLIGYPDGQPEMRESLQGWLEKALSQQVGYDKLVRELITAKGQSALDGQVTFLLRHREEPAVRVSRIFLGVRLDCARCHDHPFDRWTQQDFEHVSRFFQGLEVRQLANQNFELLDRVEATRRAAPAELPKFFTAAVPRTAMWRDEFALLVTSCKPFARTYANRIWYQLMGRGIVDPPDDLNRQNPPSSQRLLDYLTDQARAQRFDTGSMVRLICNSQAYQRASTITTDPLRQTTHDEQAEHLSQALFAQRILKPLTAEQLIDSLAQSLDLTFTVERRRELIRYCLGAADEDYSETHRYRESVQGLMMRLTENVKAPSKSLNELYLRTLSRLPLAQERERCAAHSFDDVAYALVHSNEFYFSH